jgi:hypothetical protein
MSRSRPLGALCRLPDHKVEHNWLLATLKLKFLLNFETKFTIDDWVDIIATFEVAGKTLGISLFC